MASALLAFAQARAPAPVPVMVEMFTSEGCSACRPAGELLGQLERKQPVPGVQAIALEEHVDYWDQSGWLDRFSSPLFTDRQQEYARTFHLEDIYTPQMVVNGQTEFVGSDEEQARRWILIASEEPRARVEITLRSANAVSLRVRGLPPGAEQADVLLAITERGLETNVHGGENVGRVLRHAAVVRSLTNLGRLEAAKGGAYSAVAQLHLNRTWKRANLRLVLFVQDRASRRILGVATLVL